MIMADVLMWFLVIAGAYIVFNAYWLMSEALFPGLVLLCRERYEKHPVRCTFTGLGCFLVLGVIAVLLGKLETPVTKIASVGILLVITLAALIGSTGLCQKIGLGLPGLQDELQPWRRVLRGGAVLGLTFVLPFLGWFLVLPWVLLSGLGVFISAVLRSKKSPPPAAQPPVLNPT